MRAYLKTYGCTLNQADSDIISSVLKNDDVELVDNEGAADVVIVNTCTVKKATSQRILYKLGKLNGNGKGLVVTGCMAGANQDLIEKYAPNASIITMPNVEDITSVAINSQSGMRTIMNQYKKSERIALLEPGSSIIAKVPVNDGCNSACSFCETKFARGPLNSFSEQLILKSIEYSVKRGAKEIQLTSQDMGAYGMDKHTNIAELMEKINLIEGDFKVRVGMLNPDHLHRYFDDFACALESERFYKFVHLPVQSGSNQVLRDMKRACTAEQFESYERQLRSRIPQIAIETDIIVGFPTETEKDFEETIDFVRRVRPDVTNISRFAVRPHAAASRMRQHANETIRTRSNELSRVVRSVQHETNDRFIGKKLDVIITETNDKSFNGRNIDYKQVVVIKKKGINMEIGSVYSVLINSASANVLYA